MTRWTFYAATAGVALSLFGSQAAKAQGPGNCDCGCQQSSCNCDRQQGGCNSGCQQCGYTDSGIAGPVLNAGLYPSPVQNVPPHIGGTFITNQALYPHEFLYAHQHHYLAPPFYRIPPQLPLIPKKSWKGRVKRWWRGDCDDCDRRGNLWGTEIVVKYRSKRSLLRTRFLPPR